MNIDHTELVERGGHRAVAEWLLKVREFSESIPENQESRLKSIGQSRQINQTLVRLINSDLGNAFHQPIAQTICNLLTNYDTSSLFETINTCHLVLQNNNNNKITALTVLKQAYQTQSRLLGRSYEETVQLCSKLNLHSPTYNHECVHGKIFEICSVIVAKNTGQSVHRPLLKMIQRALARPKESAAFIDSVADALESLVLAGNAQIANDLDKMIGALVEGVTAESWSEDCGHKWTRTSNSVAGICLARNRNKLEDCLVYVQQTLITQLIAKKKFIDGGNRVCSQLTFVSMIIASLSDRILDSPESYQLIPKLVQLYLQLAKTSSSSSTAFISRHSRKCVDFVFDRLLVRYNGIDNFTRLIALITDASVRSALNIVSLQKRSSCSSDEIDSDQNVLIASLAQLSDCVNELGDFVQQVIDDSSIGLLQAIQTILQTKKRTVHLSTARLVYEIGVRAPNSVNTILIKQWLPRLDTSQEKEGYAYCAFAAILSIKNLVSPKTIDCARTTATELIRSQKRLRADQRKSVSVHSGWVLMYATIQHSLSSAENGLSNIPNESLSIIFDLVEQEYLFGLKNVDVVSLIGKIGALTCYRILAQHDRTSATTSTQRIVVSKAVSYLIDHTESSYFGPSSENPRTSYLHKLFELRLLQCLSLDVFAKLTLETQSWLTKRLVANTLLNAKFAQANLLRSSDYRGDCALSVHAEVYSNVFPVNVLSSVDSSLINLGIDQRSF